MFLKPEQQLERCKRIVRQRVDPHIHPSIAQLAVESFDIPGEPMPTDEFFEKLNRGDIDFKPFTLGGEWGTTWGTVWFRLTGTVPAGYPKGKPLELILDLGWYPHSCGGHIEGLVYRADGTAIKAVHPLNYWVPFIDAEATRKCRSPKTAASPCTSKPPATRCCSACLRSLRPNWATMPPASRTSRTYSSPPI